MNLRHKQNVMIYQKVSKAEGLDPNLHQPQYQGSKAKIELRGFFTYKKLNTVPNSFICHRYDMIFYFKPEKKFSLP